MSASKISIIAEANNTLSLQFSTADDCVHDASFEPSRYGSWIISNGNKIELYMLTGLNTGTDSGIHPIDERDLHAQLLANHFTAADIRIHAYSHKGAVWNPVYAVVSFSGVPIVTLDDGILRPVDGLRRYSLQDNLHAFTGKVIELAEKRHVRESV